MAGSLTEITHLFDKVRRAGDGRWMACCPAHEDKNPSLTIRKDGDRWLFHCFAGCYIESIMEAVGLTWSDICPGRPRYAVACMQKRILPPVKESEIDRHILEIARATIQRGETISFEDQARVDLAIERLSNE